MVILDDEKKYRTRIHVPTNTVCRAHTPHPFIPAALVLHLEPFHLFRTVQFSPQSWKYSYRELILRRFSGTEFRITPRLFGKLATDHKTLDERAAPAHPPQSTQKGEVHFASRTYIFLIVFLLTHLPLQQVMSLKMLTATTHLKTMGPKLDTMCHRKYGEMQLAGGNPKQAHVRNSSTNSAVLNVSINDTVSIQQTAATAMMHKTGSNDSVLLNIGVKE